MTIVNKAEVLPFQLDKELSNEDLRMKHRYLDLRRQRMSTNLRIRHKAAKASRDFLDDQGFATELYFTDALWPDFGEQDFDRALADYSTRERRFGLREGEKATAKGAVDA